MALSFCFFACKEETQTDISGNWQTKYTVRSEFSESENYESLDSKSSDSKSQNSESKTSESPKLFLNVEQKISYEFFKDGKYTKKVFQELKSVENPDKIAIPTQEEIAEQINNELTIFGIYKTSEKQIHFSAYEIELADGTKFNYEDYMELNAFIDPCDTVEEFELKDDVLLISGLKYKKNV
ncbi:MAG: hypothetical protein SOT81_00620 [Treponema sp.]|nr:hypothetical protein [Treponema sp.]